MPRSDPSSARDPVCRRGWRTAALLLALLTGAWTARAAAAPCNGPAGACTEWVELQGGPARALIYRSHSLDAPDPHVTRLLIIIHGKNRNADHYFDTGRAAAFLAHALEDTAIVAPLMASSHPDCGDPVTPPQVDFACTGDSWRAGAPSTSHPGITSFDFIDEILRKAARREVFPNLRVVVITGHSAGGQFTQRYAMANRMHEELGVEMHYVVANPSSYPWPDAVRPLPTGDAEFHTARGAWEDDVPRARFVFGAVDARDCPDYNDWPFGLERRQTGYVRDIERERLAHQLAERRTVYLLGQVDTLPLAGFDNSCAAMLQGPTRRARGEAFVAYLRHRWHAPHELRIVPDCGHNARCIYTTDEVLPLLFPPQAASGDAAPLAAPR